MCNLSSDWNGTNWSGNADVWRTVGWALSVDERHIGCVNLNSGQYNFSADIRPEWILCGFAVFGCGKEIEKRKISFTAHTIPIHWDLNWKLIAPYRSKVASSTIAGIHTGTQTQQRAHKLFAEFERMLRFLSFALVLLWVCGGQPKVLLCRSFFCSLSHSLFFYVNFLLQFFLSNYQTIQLSIFFSVGCALTADGWSIFNSRNELAKNQWNGNREEVIHTIVFVCDSVSSIQYKNQNTNRIEPNERTR